jgi:hypothetical protein
MLSGKWGIGKTYQVREIVGQLLSISADPAKKRYVLVSLYGLKTPQEIDDAMIAALYPWSSGDGFKIAASVGKAILKHAKIELPQLASADLINRMSADVFIFDDLERCRMPITDALGYINQFVERDGCKVIVLANEEELSDNEEYKKGKEKLIGKTLIVESDFDAAFSAFITSINDAATHKLFADEKSEIREIYDQSKLQNLRILQQTMWDFERVYRAIDAEQRSNKAAMRHLIKIFFALSFEYKAGFLSLHHLESRTTRSLIDSMRNDDNPSILSLIGKKYIGLYVFDAMLNDQVTTDVIARGIVDSDALTRSLSESSWYASTNEPSWRTVWHASERPDADVEAAANLMLQEFKERHYTRTGEILHLFGQMLWLSDIGFSGRDRSQTMSDCQAYVDDLRKSDNLEPPADAQSDDIRHGSFAGLGFSQNDTPEFRAIWSYISQERAAVEVDRYAGQAISLINLMAEDASAFVRQITYYRDGSAPFAHKPVFSACDPEELAERMLELAPMDLRQVLLGLSSRYDMAALTRQLSAERPWAERLETALLEKAQALGPVTRDRISKNVRWTLGKELEELRTAEAEQLAAQ